jgi:hypothetical protein
MERVGEIWGGGGDHGRGMGEFGRWGVMVAEIERIGGKGKGFVRERDFRKGFLNIEVVEIVGWRL